MEAKYKDVQWFSINYKIDVVHCLTILIQAERDYSMTLLQMKEGCSILLNTYFMSEKSLGTHIDLLGRLSNLGVNRSIAGEAVSNCMRIVTQNKLEGDGSEKAIKTLKQKEEIFEVWTEGYRATEECGKAMFHGRVYANSFDQACISLLGSELDKDESTSDGYFRSSKGALCVWACACYETEVEARKSFG